MSTGSHGAGPGHGTASPTHAGRGATSGAGLLDDASVVSGALDVLAEDLATSRHLACRILQQRARRARRSLVAEAHRVLDAA